MNPKISPWPTSNVRSSTSTLSSILLVACSTWIMGRMPIAGPAGAPAVSNAGGEGEGRVLDITTTSLLLRLRLFLFLDDGLCIGLNVSKYAIERNSNGPCLLHQLDWDQPVRLAYIVRAAHKRGYSALVIQQHFVHDPPA